MQEWIEKDRASNVHGTNGTCSTRVCKEQVNEPGVNRVRDLLVSHRVSSTKAIQHTGISGNEYRPRAVVLDKAGATIYDPGTKVLMAGPSGIGKTGKQMLQTEPNLVATEPFGGPGTA
jgi:hypothetical protein